MRADRLISIIMLLQTHERMTAEELASELEVSQRTIYRDITALNIAGVPIYTDRGPGGGITLVESYRTTLTGINEDEARALFMLSIPQALVELGVDQKLKTALLKLSAALPDARRTVMTETQQRIYLDSSAWTTMEEPLIHLGTIHQALWQDKLLTLRYKGGFDAQIDIEVAPLGLVSKLNRWYLIGMTEGYLRVVGVKDIVEAKILERNFNRDKNFNLISEWKKWCEAYQDQRPIYQATIKVSPGMIKYLRLYIGENARFEIIETDQCDETDWKDVIILFENFFHAREMSIKHGKSSRGVGTGSAETKRDRFRQADNRFLSR